VVSKLFHKVLAARMLRYAEDNGLLHTAQNAFRSGRSTDDHIYSLSQVVKGRQRMKLPTYAFFLDLRKAYDSVWRDGLMYKLWNKGIRGRMWQYVYHMYSHTERAVRCGAATSAAFPIHLGLAQGDTLSCVLFNLYINDLLDEVEAASPGVPPLPAARKPAAAVGASGSDSGARWAPGPIRANSPS
jgi:hypothetical protein